MYFQTSNKSSEGSSNPEQPRNNEEETVLIAHLDQEEENLVKCAVCHKNIKNSKWFKHIQRKHNYLAWKEGEPSLVRTLNKVVSSLII